MERTDRLLSYRAKALLTAALATLWLAPAGQAQETQPLVANDSVTNRAKNRRVQLVIQK